MRLVPVTRSGDVHAMVDDADFAQVARFTWHLRSRHQHDRYPIRRSRVDEGQPRRLITLSRWLLGLDKGDTRVVHHLNGNPLDNRRANLVICADAKEHGRMHRGRRRKVAA